MSSTHKNPPPLAKPPRPQAPMKPPAVTPYRHPKS
jgi:hypothetical protein